MDHEDQPGAPKVTALQAEYWNEQLVHPATDVYSSLSFVHTMNIFPLCCTSRIDITFSPRFECNVRKMNYFPKQCIHDTCNGCMDCACTSTPGTPRMGLVTQPKLILPCQLVLFQMLAETFISLQAVASSCCMTRLTNVDPVMPSSLKGQGAAQPCLIQCCWATLHMLCGVFFKLHIKIPLILLLWSRYTTRCFNGCSLTI